MLVDVPNVTTRVNFAMRLPPVEKIFILACNITKCKFRKSIRYKNVMSFSFFVEIFACLSLTIIMCALNVVHLPTLNFQDDNNNYSV